MTKATFKVGNIVWRLHERRKSQTELTELRRRYIERAYAAQIDSERKLIESRIYRLQPGAQRLFLQERLRKLNERRKERADSDDPDDL